MSVLNTFAVIAAIIILGYITELIFKKTGIPDVLFLIGTGILLNTGFGWVSPNDFDVGAQLFATFALVFLLFQGSLNIDFKSLFRSFSSVAKLTFISFLLTVVTATGIMMLVFPSWGFPLALLAGMILGGTSSAVIIPMIAPMDNLQKRHKLILTLESAISDVLCIVGALTVITVIVTGQVSAAGVFKNVLSSFALALFVGAIFGLIWVSLVKKSLELKKAYMVTIAVVIGLYALVESPFVGASGAIAALAFGLILGNSRSVIKEIDNPSEDESIASVVSPSAKTFYAEISFFVKVFFFVYLGILMDFSSVMTYVWAAIIVAVIYLVRPLAVRQSFRSERLDDGSRTMLEIMVPKGLAAAVLAQLAVASNVPGAEKIVPIILAVVLISIVVTSVTALLSRNGKFRGFLGFMFKSDEVVKKEEAAAKRAAKRKADSK
jgi:NhaP-type Na+/H+ or K+/H+ antiporter